MRSKIYLIILALVMTVFVNTAGAITASGIEWWSGRTGSGLPGDTLMEWADYIENRIGSLADTGGKVWYVDNNAGLDGNDGLSWDTPKLTIAAAMALSHADIALTNKGANRNRIYVKGDDFDVDLTKLARKTDIIGVGSDDGSKMPRIIGEHVIEAASTNNYMGCRFINMYFQGDTGDTYVFDIPSGQNGIEFIGCRFTATAAGQAYGIRNTTAHDMKIIGCTFDRAAIGNEGFTTAAIGISTGSIYYLDIIGNTIDSGIGIVINSSTIPTGGQISQNTIFAATLTIDDNSDKFYIANNTLISDAAYGASAFDFADTFSVNNVLTAAGDMYNVPRDTAIEAIGTAVGAIGSFYGTASAGGTGSTTTDITGYGDDYFNTDFVMVVILDADDKGDAPEGEVVDITGYASDTGVITHATLTKATASSDKVLIARREELTVDGVALKAAPIAGSLANYIAGTGSIGTDLGAGNSLVDVLGSDGVDTTGADAGSLLGAIGTNEAAGDTPFTSASVTAGDRDGSLLERSEAVISLITTGTTDKLTAPADTYTILDILGTDGSTTTGAVAGSILGAIGTNELAANTPFSSSTVQADADGSVLERLEQIDVDTSAILTDTGTDGVVLKADAITASKIQTDSIGAPEITADALGASELANTAVHEIAEGVIAAETSGSVFYVDTGGDNSDGLTWATAKTTISGGVGLATASANDIIYVGAGHALSITGAGGLTMNKIGVQVIGCGEGLLAPTITFTTSTSADLEIDNSCSFTNFIFDCASLDGMLAPIDVDAADVSFNNCRFLVADGSAQAVTTINLDANADRFLVNKCRFEGGGNDGPGSVVTTVATAPSDVKIIDCWFEADCDNGVIYGTSTPDNLIIQDSHVSNVDAGVAAIVFTSTATGIIKDCTVSTDTYATAIDPGTMEVYNVLWYDSDNPADNVGIPVLAANASAGAQIGDLDLANIETQVSDGLIADNLDHLMLQPVADDSGDIELAEVIDKTVLSWILSDDGDTAGWLPTTDSLEAISDKITTGTDSLSGIQLDHFAQTIAGGTHVYPDDVTNETHLAYILSKSAEAAASSFDNTDDSLEAIRGAIGDAYDDDDGGDTADDVYAHLNIIQSGSSGGRTFYVDTDNAVDTGNGLTWATAKQKIASGVALMTDDGDTLYVRGGTALTETVVTPSGVDQGKIISVDLSKRRPMWSPGATDEVALTIIGANWELHNLRFQGATTTVPLVKVDTSGSYNGDGSVIKNCYFHGGGDSETAILYYGGSIQNELIGCHITDFGGTNLVFSHQAAVCGDSYVQSAGHYLIKDNWFSENVNHLKLQAFTCVVTGNHFQAEGNVRDATGIINLVCAGEDVGGNMVTNNYFGDVIADIDNTAGYYGTTDDLWSGNHCEDADDWGVPAAT